MQTQWNHHTLISVILFLPNQSSSKPAKVSKFSISCIDNQSWYRELLAAAYPYSIRSQFQIPQLSQSIKSLNLLYLVLNKV